MKKVTKISAAFMAALMILSCVGCSKPAEPAVTEAGAPAATQAATPAATQAATQAAAQAATETEPAILTVRLAADIDNFNPFTNQTTDFIAFFAFNCYEPLFHLNEEMQYEMDLATAVEQVDDLTIKITTRDGVKFQDGSEFGPEDVVFTIEKILDESVGAWRASQYANVESVEATGANEATIKLKTPTPAFLDSLAYTPIVSRNVDMATLDTTINGTGAYQFISWTPNDNITLDKYEGYWDADKVNFDKLVIRPIPDETTAITNLETGIVDILNNITVDGADVLNSKSGVKVITSKISNTIDEFEIGRHNCEPLQNNDVLRAMALCLDREAINEAIFGGLGKIPTSVYPSGTKYHVDAYTDGYDIEKAKEILATTPYADGFEFDITIGGDRNEQEALIWQSDLAKIGITMNVKRVEFSVWLDTYLNRSYDMIANGYGMVGTDPATFDSVILSQLFEYQAADIPELKELVDEAAATTDETVRKADYEKIQKIMAEYMPTLTFIERPLVYGAAESVQGLEINGMGHVFLKGVSK